MARRITDSRQSLPRILIRPSIQTVVCTEPGSAEKYSVPRPGIEPQSASDKDLMEPVPVSPILESSL